MRGGPSPSPVLCPPVHPYNGEGGRLFSTGKKGPNGPRKPTLEQISDSPSFFLSLPLPLSLSLSLSLPPSLSLSLQREEGLYWIAPWNAFSRT